MEETMEYELLGKEVDDTDGKWRVRTIRTASGKLARIGVRSDVTNTVFKSWICFWDVNCLEWKSFMSFNKKVGFDKLINIAISVLEDI